MSTPNPDATAFDWAQECAYISNETDAAQAGRTSSTFNNDPSCLRRYAQMQQKVATKQGKHDAAAYIGHCIDDLSFFA